jgi:hypothetical protein
MKKSLILFFGFIIAIFFNSCKGNDLAGLEYADISIGDWLQANVQKKSGERVMWFQVFDMQNERATIESYADISDKLKKYPAKINNNKWVWILVNKRIEIRLIADDKSKDYQDTEKLKKFLLSFDLAGMEGVTGDKISGKEMQKFLPQLIK